MKIAKTNLVVVVVVAAAVRRCAHGISHDKYHDKLFERKAD